MGFFSYKLTALFGYRINKFEMIDFIKKIII